MVSEVILCKYCNTEKDRSEFAESNLKKHYIICKCCISNYNKTYRKLKIESMLVDYKNELLECRFCNEFKRIDSFYKSDLFPKKCKQCSYKRTSMKRVKTTFKTFVTEEDVLNYLSLIHKGTKKVHNAETSSMRLSRGEIYELLREQDFKCAITKISFLNHLNPLLKPSIDRIDSNIGYRKENCQIVLRFINLGKNKHSQEELFECLKMIKENV